MEFKNWFEQVTLGTEFVDERQINALYDKAKYAVKLVQLYSKTTRQNLLNNISTIAPLTSGAYGLYNSAENKKVIGPQVISKIRFKFGNNVMQNQKINQVPNAVLKQYIPDLDMSQVKPSDVIKVNIQKILQKYGDSKEAVIEIASTIVHEATHSIELQSTGKTNEIGPQNAERKFIDWVSKNWKTIIQRIPQLKNFKNNPSY
jgi:hypothetical protein